MRAWVIHNFALFFLAATALSTTAAMGIAFVWLPAPLLSVPVAGIAATTLILSAYPRARQAVERNL